ncbi:hypothetical protein ACSBR2_003828 [Camellia fascicularis]
MARDVLSVPATTVASEAAFSVGGRVIDETRASLLPDIVEALITCNDWIKSPKNRKNLLPKIPHYFNCAGLHNGVNGERDGEVR